MHRGITRVEEAEDTASIARTLQGDLMSISKDGDALIVWMLDQSLSMQLDMKDLAQELVDTLQEIERSKNTPSDNFVFGTGTSMKLLCVNAANSCWVVNFFAVKFKSAHSDHTTLSRRST